MMSFKWFKNLAVGFLFMMLIGLLLRCLTNGVVWEYDGVRHHFLIVKPQS